MWVQNRVLMPSPPPRESTALRGTLTPACILISIIPPSINSKSTCFTPGEKNNPRLVSPASPGAAEGLNPPDSLPLPFPWAMPQSGLRPSSRGRKHSQATPSHLPALVILIPWEAGGILASSTNSGQTAWLHRWLLWALGRYQPEPQLPPPTGARFMRLL